MVRESQGTFLVLQNVRELFLNAIINVKLKDLIFIQKMSRFSFHTSCKIMKMVREICVQVREKVWEHLFPDFWWDF